MSRRSFEHMRCSRIGCSVYAAVFGGGTFVILAAACLVAAPAHAESRTSTVTATPVEVSRVEPTPATEPTGTGLGITPIAYVEASYSYSFAAPSNGVINYRAFGNRHDSLTLECAAAGLAWQLGSVGGKVIFQVGTVPNVAYAAEPASPGGSGAPGTGPDTWKFIQEANVGWTAPLGRGLLLQAGLFTSPIGPEAIAAKDDWNWSRSDLFFALPYYHTGGRATYSFGERISATAALYSGWSSVVDNNRSKSVSASLNYKLPDLFLAQLLYFGGVERASGAPEGAPWRHTLDAYAQLDLTPRFSVLAHVDAGTESTSFGRASWLGAALYARVQLLDWAFLAVRGDRFQEWVPTGDDGAASPLFWAGAAWVTSGTATVDIRPADHFALRLEYRHDAAERPLYYRKGVLETSEDGVSAPNARHQDTITVGVTSWL